MTSMYMCTSSAASAHSNAAPRILPVHLHDSVGVNLNANGFQSEIVGVGFPAGGNEDMRSAQFFHGLNLGLQPEFDAFRFQETLDRNRNFLIFVLGNPRPAFPDSDS